MDFTDTWAVTCLTEEKPGWTMQSHYFHEAVFVTVI